MESASELRACRTADESGQWRTQRIRPPSYLQMQTWFAARCHSASTPAVSPDAVVPTSFHGADSVPRHRERSHWDMRGPAWWMDPPIAGATVPFAVRRGRLVSHLPSLSDAQHVTTSRALGRYLATMESVAAMHGPAAASQLYAGSCRPPPPTAASSRSVPLCPPEPLQIRRNRWRWINFWESIIPYKMATYISRRI
ncbi:hypothetical protein OsI_28264 [Oryza sativa Indica Group]|uniref:Uncharacterized protein n=1 Tax=Oryza sativa subsp. indica TaxID=39946 RepID=B8BBX9_ORYSI|nr:hypothetical protein OsI_28264 [Oryza sativa Indica Group]